MVRITQPRLESVRIPQSVPSDLSSSESKPSATVDVRIPAHGRPQFLAKAIESVFSQTLTSWTLVISEDGDGGGEIEKMVEPFLSDPRVSYVHTGGHVGAASNMTNLIRRGSAPYVALLHDDDFWDAEYLEHHVAFLEANPQVGWVFSLVKLADESGWEIRRLTPEIPAGIYTSEELAPRLLRTNFVEGIAILVRREAYEAVGSTFDAQFERIYDWDMYVRLATKFSTGHLHVWEYAWRLHGAQSTVEGRLRGEEKLRFLNHAEAEVRDALPDLHLSRRLQARTRSRTYLTLAIDALEKNEPRNSVREAARALKIYPLSIVDPQTPLVLIGAIGGRRVRRAIGDLRLTARRRLLKIHISK
jgi:glycosyltransferase involved in cell wall biosynthesis